MCGIVGFLQQNNQKVSLESLKRMIQVLKHRGPDDEGYFLINSLSGRNFDQQSSDVGLAHSRLSILDLSPLGHQPMSNESKDIWISYNGEVYNFEEIKKELLLKGYRFSSHTDTEVILYAYQEWGIECINKFIGMFALSIWDNHKRKLYLIRDRLGIKPLYYYYKNGNFAFASELKGILEYPYFEKELNLDSLYDYFLFQYVPSPETIFKYVYKLPPGHFIEVSKDGDFRISTYWDATEKFFSNKEKGNEFSEEEALSELKGILKSSVRYRMISDVPIGMTLSGGIDSSLVTAVMQESSSKPIKTFTIGFTSDRFNEASYANKIAKYLGTDHHELYVTPKEAQEAITDLPFFYDEPFADSSSIPTYIVSKLVRSYVKVVLSGDGGDELFGGYKRYEWERQILSYNLPHSLRKGIAGVLYLFPENLISKFYEFSKRILPEGFRESNLVGKKDYLINLLSYKNPVDLYLSLVTIWRDPQLSRLLGIKKKDIDFILKDLYTKGNKKNIVELLMLTDLKTYLVDDILTKVDRASMAVSLENRVPLLDHRLVEFSFGLPFKFKYKKYLTKRLLSQYLPPELFERPKHGFSVPVSDWLRGDLSFLIREYLAKERIKKEGILNYDYVEKIVNEHLSFKKDYGNHIWSLIVFEMWYEKYG